MRMTERTVLLTGGAGGIGLALARELIRRGNIVIATGRDEAKLTAARAALPELRILVGDVADAEQIVALHRHVTAEFPALDVVINNAGIMRNLKLREPRDLADVTREIDVNLSGPVRMVQQFLPHLSSRPEALIVNISSGLAFVPLPASPVYSAAKAGLRAYTRSLRWQLADTQVRVVEVAPPPIETSLFRGEFAAEMAGEKAMDPAALAAAMITGIEAGREDILPGVAKILATATRIAPRLVFGQMARLSRPKRPRS